MLGEGFALVKHEVIVSSAFCLLGTPRIIEKPLLHLLTGGVARGVYLPAQVGLRFSTKAFMPSF